MDPETYRDERHVKAEAKTEVKLPPSKEHLQKKMISDFWPPEL